MERAGLYIHIPFCEQKCAYCDFCSFQLGEAWQSKYIDALISQSKQYKGLYKYDTVFIGGGTPTCLKLGEITRLYEGISRNLDIAPIEFTIEGNPNSFDESKANEFVALGMTRASVGVQSFDDSMLKALGRLHNSSQAISTLKMLVNKGIKVNCDIMIGLPNDSEERALKDIDIALSLGVNHISCYSLIVEDGTKLSRQVECGEVVLLDSDTVANIYDAVRNKLHKARLPRYEISNFGEPCIHNMGYWELKPYLGLGLSAHSLLGRKREFNTDNLQEYIDGKRAEIEEILSDRDFASDAMILGLRTAKGADLRLIQDNCAKEVYDMIMEIVNDNLDLLCNNGNYVTIKEDYWYCSNLIMEKFLLD